jgi:hypothetical protein
MALLYVDEHAASLNYGEVTSGETLHEGEFIVDNGDGTFARFDPANDEIPDGIIVHDPGGDAIAEHDEDYFADYEDLWSYEAGEHFYWQPLASVDQIRPKALSDNGTDPAPTFDVGEIIGIVTINTETEVVPSGYTDDAGTTYSEGGAGDFKAIGRMDKYPQELRIQSSFGQRIPTRLDASEFHA